MKFRKKVRINHLRYIAILPFGGWSSITLQNSRVSSGMRLPSTRETLRDRERRAARDSITRLWPANVHASAYLSIGLIMVVCIGAPVRRKKSN
jgi:hypothetical protein